MIVSKLRQMLGHDRGEREQKAREVEALGARSDATLERVDRALAERQRVITATRNAVKALRHTHR